MRGIITIEKFKLKQLNNKIYGNHILLNFL